MLRETFFAGLRVAERWRLPPGRLFQAASPGVARFGLALLGSLLVCHVVFH
ncbi:MAG: hypothetical protein V3U03_09740 [Myxococcota bacterium]